MKYILQIDKIILFFKKYNSSKKNFRDLQINIKIGSNWQTRLPTLLQVLPKQATSVDSIFPHSSFSFHIIWWGHRNINLNIHVVYIICIFILFALFFKKNIILLIIFLATNPEMCNFNFLKKVYSRSTIRKNVKLTKLSRLT